MRRVLLNAALCLATITSVYASTRIIPVAGNLPGANGTSWTTDLSLTNGSASAVVVDLVFHPEDGIARTRSVQLDANQSILLEDAVGPTKFPGTNPASWLGQLEVRSTGSVNATAHIFTRGAAGGTYGGTYEDFDPSVLSTSGSIAGLIQSTHFRTNVAFANSNDQTNGFDYILRHEDGSVAATRHLDVPGHATRQLSIGDDVAQSSDDRRLSLTWTASSSGYVAGSIVDNKSGDPTSAPSTSRNETQLFFPVVGKTPGNNSTFWSTSAAVTSDADGAGSVTFVYVDNSTGLTHTKTSPLSTRATVSTDDLNAFISAPLGTGSLTITSTMAIVAAVRVFNTQADGSTFGSAILAQSNVVRLSKVRVEGVRRDDDYRLNVAISNDDSNATSGTVRLFDDHGIEVENEPFHVEHGKSTQVSMARGIAQVHSGHIEVETENGIAVTVIASNVDNHTGDTMQHESEQENERQNEIELVIEPSSAAAGSPVAFSLKNAGTSVVGVSWTFGDGTAATGATATHTYASAGEFEVNAQITLTGGSIVRAREDVRIGTGPVSGPTSIDFTFSPSAPAVGQEIVFTASGASSGGTFNWKFPGDVRKSGNVVTFTFAAAGSYEVELELEHSGSPTLQATKVVTVGGGTGNPGSGQIVTSIDFSSSPQAPRAGQAVTFTASFDRQPPAGSVVKWRFPDNSRPEGTTASYTFAAAGTYTVRVQIEQPGQPSIEREKSVTITP
jgi:FOG: PKD repeat